MLNPRQGNKKELPLRMAGVGPKEEKGADRGKGGVAKGRGPQIAEEDVAAPGGKRVGPRRRL